MDRALVSHPGLVRLLQDTAEAEGIRIQYKAPLLGSTDSGAIHLTRAGVPAITAAIPCRYIHSPAAILNLNDLADTVRLVGAALRRIERHHLTRVRTTMEPLTMDKRLSSIVGHTGGSRAGTGKTSIRGVRRLGVRG